MLDAGRVRAEKAINTEPIELKCLRALGFIVTSECMLTSALLQGLLLLLLEEQAR